MGFNDAIKLFSKEIITPCPSNFFQYFLSPFFALLFVMAIYFLFPFKEISYSVTHSTIFIYIILRLNVYPVLISGWSSNRKYALIGSLRAVAQTVSYEVSLAIILIFYFLMSASLNMYTTNVINSLWPKIFMFLPIIGI